MPITLEQFKNTVAPLLNIRVDKSLGQKAMDQLINSNPALAAKMGVYNKILDGKPILRAAKGGYLFAADELGDPRVKERMKDNPEFSEFSIDKQDATANKLQQRFAQPEDRMQQQPARGYAVGGQPVGRRLPDFGPGGAPKGFPDEGGGNNNFVSNELLGQQPVRPYPPMVSDPKRPPQFGTNRPYQPDSKVARADTRKFGQQPQPLRPSRPGTGGDMIPFEGPGGPIFPEAELFNRMPASRPAQPTSLSYEAALNRTRSRDVKEPQEQANIDAALALGPGGVYNIEQASDQNFIRPQKDYRSIAQPAVYPDSRSDLNKLADAQKDIMEKTYTDPGSVITKGITENIVPSDYNEIAAGTGQVTGDVAVDLPRATDVATVAEQKTEGPAGVAEASTSEAGVKAATDGMTSATGTVGDDAQVTAATDTTSSVSDLKEAQGTAALVTNPVQRKIEAGELVTGAADAATAAAFTEQIEAATATPSDKATVKGQLDTLMDDFDGGETPVWAAGAMRAANAAMAARGLGASSMAGQAIIQAAMESAIPIAQVDAATTAQFEMQNLSNRQQRSMLAAEQRATFMGMEFTQEFQARVQNSARIGDIANMNFTAEQQIALENGRAANTMNLANLSNSQAMVMAEAAALSNLDMANLNNRQQAAVQNAQNFMQMDMQNLSNEQQTSMFKQQSIVQSLFTDQAATNAASQFNATSETQTQQFFASLANQTGQFNATQTNAMSTFDAEQTNTLKRFNAEVDNQRDQFNAKNSLIIAQSNAQWRQNASTLNTAAANEANMEYAKNVNGLTSTALDQMWQRERDLMSFAFNGAEKAADRAVTIATAKLSAAAKAELADNMGKGKLFSTLLTGFLGGYTGFKVPGVS